MKVDMRALQPTNNTIVSYNMLDMADTDMLPEWRLTSKNTSAGVGNDFMVLANMACLGLMSNKSAITQLKVQPSHLHVSGRIFYACARLWNFPPMVHKQSRCLSRSMVSAGLWG